MAEPPASNDPLTSAADALRGDRTNVRDLLSGVKERAQARARDRFASEMDNIAPSQAPAARTIPVKAPAKPLPVPKLDPDWPVDIRLEGGKRVRATIVPGVARRKDIADLGRVTAANDQRAYAELRRQRRAIVRLRKAHADLANQVAALQQQSDQALVKALHGIRGFEQKFQTAKVQNQQLATSINTSKAVAARQQQELRTLTMASRVQTVNAAVNSVQSAAYGDRGSLFTKNNLFLAGNQVFWGFLGPVLQGLGFISGASANIVSALAPVGSITVGQVAVGNQQRERFVSGVVTFDGVANSESQSLEDKVTADAFNDLRRRNDVPVSLSQLDFPITFLIASVRNGIVQIESRFEQVPPPGRVAYTVDLGADVG